MVIAVEIEGLQSVADVNTLTMALISLAGAENVEVSTHWAEVDGVVSRQVVVDAIQKAGYRLKA